MAECPHKNVSDWSAWHESAEGVTHMMESREKYCDDCGKPVNREVRNGRKLN